MRNVQVVFSTGFCRGAVHNLSSWSGATVLPPRNLPPASQHSAAKAVNICALFCAPARKCPKVLEEPKRGFFLGLWMLKYFSTKWIVTASLINAISAYKRFHRNALLLDSGGYLSFSSLTTNPQYHCIGSVGREKKLIAVLLMRPKLSLRPLLSTIIKYY